MGNQFTCFSPSKTAPEDHHHHLLPPWLNSPLSSIRKSRKQKPSPNNNTSSSSSSPQKSSQILDESYIKQQAQIASMLYHHHLQNNSDLLLNLERSVSTKNPPSLSKKQKQLSKRSRSVSHANPLSVQLSPQDLLIRNEGGPTDPSESKHFVLVHGGGFGAWCWYKIIALLKDGKSFEVDAIDLNGSGLNFCDINSITTLEEYTKPLTDFLKNLPNDKKVILVGHDFGGACISHAMELYPSKVSKAIFVAATMLTDGHSALDVFSQQSCLTDLNRQAQKFVYANGKNKPPTAIDFDKSLLEDLLFNRTPSKDIALASVSMRGLPFAPVAEKLSLSTKNYGSILRFYVKTDEDFAIPVTVQEAMIQSDPPKQVFELKGSDHSPFFSRPQALHRILSEISNLPVN